MKVNVYHCPACDTEISIDKKNYCKLSCPLCHEWIEKTGEGELNAKTI